MKPQSTLSIVFCLLFSAGLGSRVGMAQDSTAGLVPILGTPAPPPPPDWPRTYSKAGDSLVMYAPQIDAWKDHEKIRFRAAIVLTPAASGKAEYGVVAVSADTLIDNASRTVLMTNMNIAVRFPGMATPQALTLEAQAISLLPVSSYMDVSLDHVLAHIHEPPKLPKVPLNLDPPPIFYSDVPAILVIYTGEPQFKPIPKTELMFAVNTNWVVIMDIKSGNYYLLDDESWLTATDPVKGPWTAAASLPAELSKLPADGNWADVKKHIPGTPAKAASRVIVSTVPAELIVTAGAADYTPIAGTRLMYVSNPQMPLFLDLIDSNYYFLASGRWFRAKDIGGPWTAASADLPIEFVKIPADNPMGFVLASIPNTQEAQDAILLASIPHKATINISDAKVAVAYDGPPKFVPIETTTMTYAVNTSYQVISTGGQYYCCYQGVWFMSGVATGPWLICTSVPSIIYTIPPSSPIYNCTYVRVYSSTPTTVVVGYTAGYSGEYVAATGALMFGAGILVGAALADNSWHSCGPCFYSYGCAAHYSYAYGGYYRAGGSCYGPHGGAGWGASYNPATGTYARAGASYGPAGAHWGAQAYNPFTNTYAQHKGGTNGYSSWGSSYVQQGNKWAQSAHFQDTAVARTSSGDLYAGHDGNVYKKSDDGWQKYSGGGNWQDSTWTRPTPSSGSASGWQDSFQSRAQSNSATNSWKNDWSSNSSQYKSSWENRDSSGGNSWGQHDTFSGLNSDSWSRDRGSSNASSSWRSRSSGWGGGGGGWGERSGGGWGGRSGGGFGRFGRR